MPNRVRSIRIRRGKAKRGVRYGAAQKKSREDIKEERLIHRASARGFGDDEWE